MLKQVNVLKRNFPNARIILCHFHVKGYFDKHMKEYGQFSLEEYRNLNHAVHEMVYADSEQKYNEAVEDFKENAGGDDSRLWEYFEKNWAPVTDMWVEYLRQSIPHFKNRTTNMIESNFGVLKIDSNPSDSMRDTLECIDRMQKRCEEKYSKAVSAIGTHTDATFDLELNMVRSFVHRPKCLAVQ